MLDKLPSDIILCILDYSPKFTYDNCHLVSKYLNKISTKKYVKDCIHGIKSDVHFAAYYYVKYAQYYEDIGNDSNAENNYLSAIECKPHNRWILHKYKQFLSKDL